MACGIYTTWGYNLACSFCDTEFESYNLTSLIDIIKEVNLLSIDNHGNRIRNLVVITGGEPFRQPIEKLCNTLIESKYMVQIETNGLLFRKLPKEVIITCSPKNTSGKYKRLCEDLLPHVSALKFLISKNNLLYNHVSEIGQTDYKTPLYVQPIDEYDIEKNKQNYDYTLEITTKFGYRISLQTHKIFNIE